MAVNSVFHPRPDSFLPSNCKSGDAGAAKFRYHRRVFKNRSKRAERIDTGDYTPAEYDRFLTEIAFINRVLGDRRALAKTLFAEIRRSDLSRVSVLDVGSGSGELLRSIADFASKTGRTAELTGIDLHEKSASATGAAIDGTCQIASVRGNALQLPFADNAFDYAISSLFFHHLTDEQIVDALKEMSRVARRGIFVIDLHRHPIAYLSFKLFCLAFRMSRLVREDGSLSILRGFKPAELQTLGSALQFRALYICRFSPFRLVLIGKTNQS